MGLVGVMIQQKSMNVTNLQNEGWISADRGTKATLMRTIPRSLFKSYTKDLSLPIFELVFSIVWSAVLSHQQCRRNVMILDVTRKWPILTHVTSGKATISPLSSMDSGLEAFSRNPTHGSFSALTFQSTEFTNYVNQRFLSYWIGLLLRRPLHQ